MISTATLFKTLGAVGAIGGASWVLDVPNEVRTYVSEPLRLEIRDVVNDQLDIMASMKHYDIRTDELSADINTLDTKIKSMEKYIEDHLSGGSLSPDQSRNKLFLEHQIENDKIDRKIKQDSLIKAVQEDEALLKKLTQAQTI